MSEIPADVASAAERRAVARAAHDWATADALRAEIEEAGWKVIDAGSRYRLERAYAPDVVGDGVVRYGRVESVPSRLAEPDSAAASVVIVAQEGARDAARAVRALRRTAPDTSIVVVADGIPAEDEETLVELGDVELARTAQPLGYGAGLEIGIRLSTGTIVTVLDPSVEPTGDVLTPLVEALDDPSIAVAGPFGLVSRDLRHFDEVEAGDAAAIEGYLMAFRRRDARDRGPIDPHFRFYRNADIWWSLVLRDEGEDAPPRRAVVVPGLPLVRHEHRGWTALPPAERDRLSKRNFYRVIDRFGHRDDLAVPRS